MEFYEDLCLYEMDDQLPGIQPNGTPKKVLIRLLKEVKDSIKLLEDYNIELILNKLYMIAMIFEKTKIKLPKFEQWYYKIIDVIEIGTSEKIEMDISHIKEILLFMKKDLEEHL